MPIAAGPLLWWAARKYIRIWQFDPWLRHCRLQRDWQMSHFDGKVRFAEILSSKTPDTSQIETKIWQHISTHKYQVNPIGAYRNRESIQELCKLKNDTNPCKKTRFPTEIEKTKVSDDQHVLILWNRKSKPTEKRKKLEGGECICRASGGDQLKRPAAAANAK